MSESGAVLAAAFESQLLVRSLHFHNTPRGRAAEYDKQLEQYSRRFTSVDEQDLKRYLTTGQWHKTKPGLIVALFNGYRNNFDVLLPLLERHGFTGWFFVVTGFTDAAPSEQKEFAEARHINLMADEYEDGRYALSWDEVKTLDKRHVVASHTRTHCRLSMGDERRLENEIVGSQQDLVARLGHRVDSFASLSGEAIGLNERSDRLIEQAGYELLFSTFKIQRLRGRRR